MQQGQTIDAYAALLDFIAVPHLENIAHARRMVFLLTNRIPDAEGASELSVSLNSHLNAVVQASVSTKDFAAIYEAQESAREMLDWCKRLGTQ